VPAFALAAGAIAIPTVASLLLVAVFGHETRGRDLRELELVPVPVPVVVELISPD
jgi:putative MFS transporter